MRLKLRLGRRYAVALTVHGNKLVLGIALWKEQEEKKR